MIKKYFSKVYIEKNYSDFLNMDHQRHSAQMKKNIGESQSARRDAKKYATGFSDNLQPLETLDLSKIKGFDDLAKAMSKTAFGGRTLGEAADVLYEMATDKDCKEHQ